MKHYSHLIISFAMIALAMACNPQPVGNQKAILEEMEDREIKRVTKAEILEAATAKGEEISAVAQKELAGTLMQTIATQGFAQAIEYCNMIALPMTDSIAKQHKVNIRRVSTRVRNSANSADSIERELLEAYQYAIDNGLDGQSGVQELDDNVVLYTKPIMLSNPVCLNCHGQAGSDIAEENYALLQSKYPSDSAISYKMGDLRGMWSIRFQKKELIRGISK